MSGSSHLGILIIASALAMVAYRRKIADRAKVSGAKCEIVSRLETPLPLVDGDGDRLFQVISNLLGNAVKYSPDGGEVLVTTSHGDGEVRISVKDHGVGIAPEDLPRLFQRYERIVSNSGHKISGTGLGLVIARQRAQASAWQGTRWLGSCVHKSGLLLHRTHSGQWSREGSSPPLEIVIQLRSIAIAA